jgi:8-oxo-dGTP pyrophosphatase MutT (NUDIX family)
MKLFVHLTEMKRAAVACILRGDRKALFIKRAARVGDRWSGHIAFPGGRQEVIDNKDDLATCMREVREEVGLDLSRGFDYLGRVDDIQMIENGRLGLVVSCFVFKTDENKLELQLETKEVAASGWADLACIKDPHRLIGLNLTINPTLLGVPTALQSYARSLGLDQVVFPAVKLDLHDKLGEGDFIVWGLTLRFVQMIEKVQPLRLTHDKQLLGMFTIERRFVKSYFHDVLWTAMKATIKRKEEHPSASIRFYFWALHCGALAAITSGAYVLRNRL